MGAFYRPVSLEERTRQVQQQLADLGRACTWHDARREMSRRSAVARRWKARKRAVAGPGVPVVPYKGSKLVAAKNLSAQDVASINAQAAQLRQGRARELPYRADLDGSVRLGVLVFLVALAVAAGGLLNLPGREALSGHASMFPVTSCGEIQRRESKAGSHSSMCGPERGQRDDRGNFFTGDGASRHE